MIAFIITVVVSLCLNFLLFEGHKELINEAADLGSILSKTFRDYPMAMTAFSVIFPIISVILVVVSLMFLRQWVPYARSKREDSEKDS